MSPGCSSMPAFLVAASRLARLLAIDAHTHTRPPPHHHHHHHHTRELINQRESCHPHR
jgi:hypothetical protein